ncbi:DUF932 domain-containing protein [Fibrobacterota bacterium]
MNLMHASNQWATRPFDERFETVTEMKESALQQAKASFEISANIHDVEVVPINQDIGIRRKSNGNDPAILSNWSFGQLCNISGSPAGFLRTLNPEMATDILNYKLQEREDRESNIFLYKNGVYNVRSINSEKYGRIWDHKICQVLEVIENSGWQCPPARPISDEQPGTRRATIDDVLKNSAFPGLGVKEGDLIAPAGLYRGDRDLFAFMVDDNKRIEDGSEGGLYRGIIVRNSEVGAAYFELMTFLYRSICGNHIIWETQDVKSFRIKHVGNAEQRLSTLMKSEIQKYITATATNEEQKIKKAKKTIIGKDKEKVIDRLFGLRLATRQILGSAFNSVVPEIDGSPRSVYGLMNGLTRLSQKSGYSDKRFEIDKAAGQLMKLVE